MKILPSIAFILPVVLTASAVAEDVNASLLIANQPVSLVTSDGKNRTISDCNGFIQLRQNDLLIKSIEVEPDSAYNQARVDLIKCNLNWQSSFNKLSRKNIAIEDIGDFFEHLPANAVLAVSKDESIVVDNASFKSLRSDLKGDGNAMYSEKNKEKYTVSDYFSLNGRDNLKFEIIAINVSLTEGTLSKTDYYEIVDKTKSIWKLKPLDWNSKL